MKSANLNDDNHKPTQSKQTKKSTKSRSKSASQSNSTKTTINSNNNNHIANAPTTPTSSSSVTNNYNASFDANSDQSGAMLDVNHSGGSNSSRNHQKSYAGFEPRSIKIIWEQHDQSDVELSQEVCTRLAEDATYKLWELINNVKTYTRHSGGYITYDIVNEVLRDADVPPALGAMDSAWDRVDYDGSYFFYSDKILELREEYQREVSFEIPMGADFLRSWTVEEKHAEIIKQYIPSIVYVTLYGDNKSLDVVLHEVTVSPLIGSSYRVLLAKIVQILAFKQNDRVSLRCWRLLRACTVNPYVREVDCREEYFHLAEVLVCQLIGPIECIKLHNSDVDKKSETKLNETTSAEVKTEEADVKIESDDPITKNNEAELETPMEQSEHLETDSQQQQQSGCKIFRLQSDEEGSNDSDINLAATASGSKSVQQFSPYFATPVELKNVETLCGTLGHLAAVSAYFEGECLFLIMRRLVRFFEGRNISTDKEYSYIGRALRGLTSLGGYAFREFIPFIYKFEPEHIPEKIWNDIALSAIYLQGPDDIFLYEWLEYVCGGDKLQPFMVYSAEYHEKLLTNRYLHRKQATFKIIPKLGVRRLEWSSLAAAMCFGDDPSKALKPKPTFEQIFPDVIQPNLKLNRAGTIRFKFAGCRPLKQKSSSTNASSTKLNSDQNTTNSSAGNIAHHDILIAKRRLFKPLTNERRMVMISNYFYLRI